MKTWIYINHVIKNSISKNEYFTPRHFLRSCINALPTIIALRKIRSGHPNVIPDVVVPNRISCVVVRYALTILIVIFFYRTSWSSVMGRIEVCHWPTWNSKGSANWKKTYRYLPLRIWIAGKFNYWKNYNEILSNSYLKRRPQKTPNIAHIWLLFFLCFPYIPPRFWCFRSTPMALFHPHMRNLHSANFLIRFLDHHWHLPMNDIFLISYLNSFRISFAFYLLNTDDFNTLDNLNLTIFDIALATLTAFPLSFSLMHCWRMKQLAGRTVSSNCPKTQCLPEYLRQDPCQTFPTSFWTYSSRSFELSM